MAREGCNDLTHLRPRGTYTEWFWPPPPAPGGYRSFEHVLTPELDPGLRTPWYWAHQFRLEGGDGGYLGLQTWGNLDPTHLDRIAIFSIWDALAAEGEHHQEFGGEGTGYSCRISYPWVAGRSYRLRVETDEPGWWAASVTDVEADVTRLIGRIRVKEQVTGLGRWSVMWTEYYGALVRCADLTHSRVVFGIPTADDGVVPERRHSHVNDGDCQESSVDDVAGGVRHEMGAPPPEGSRPARRFRWRMG